MEFEIKEINEKREYLYKLIEEKSLDILSEEVIKASEELDKLIYKYYEVNLPKNDFYSSNKIK